VRKLEIPRKPGFAMTGVVDRWGQCVSDREERGPSVSEMKRERGEGARCWAGERNGPRGEEGRWAG